MARSPRLVARWADHMTMSNSMQRCAFALLVATTLAGCAGATSQPHDATFPSEVAGLPVIGVACRRACCGRASSTVRPSRWLATTTSSPHPARIRGGTSARSRAGAGSRPSPTPAPAPSCASQGRQWHELQPAIRNESGALLHERDERERVVVADGGATGEPAALVLVGHAGDARQWQCTSATQAQCASAFVVDRIAWAEGHDVPPAAPRDRRPADGQGDHAEDDARAGRGRDRARR